MLFMKSCPLILVLSLLSFSLFAQHADAEKMHPFLDVEQFKQETVIKPVVDEILTHQETEEGLFEAFIPIMSPRGITELNFNTKFIREARIVKRNNDYYLYLKTAFPVNAEQMMAKAFYQLNVCSVRMNGKDVEVYDYAREYHRMERELLQNNINYLQD